MRGGDFEKSVQLYLREAGRYPPLGADEEKRLAQRARRGDKEAKNKLIRTFL